MAQNKHDLIQVELLETKGFWNGYYKTVGLEPGD